MNQYLNDPEYLFTLLTVLVKKNNGRIVLTEEELQGVSTGDLIGMYYEPKTGNLILKEVDPKDARLITIANDLKDDIDYLIFAFADSRYDISGSRGEQEERIEDTLSDVELGWSDKLRRVYRRKDS